jgi:hypothetical protein
LSTQLRSPIDDVWKLSPILSNATLTMNRSRLAMNEASDRTVRVAREPAARWPAAPAPQRGVVYTMTPVGRGLEPAILALGRWGSTQLDEPRPGEIVTPESLTMSLRAVFDEAAAAGTTASWEIHSGDIVVYAVVTDGKLEAGAGPAPATPDLVITFRPDDLPSYRALLQAARCGLVELTGPRELLETFIRLFTTRPADAQAA